MAFPGQAIEILSQPPGSLIYHLLTLMSLQIVLALAYSNRNRTADNESARRMMFSAAAIILTRLIFLLIALWLENDPPHARIVLPPLEQAINTATVILLVWGLAPFAIDRSRLADGTLILSIIGIAVMFLIFFQDWQNRLALTGAAVLYISTVQAYFWNILQIIILGSGLLWLVAESASRFTIRPIIVTIALLAHLANFFNYPELIPSGTEVSYWIRLGYLIAFPLWAVLAYQENRSALIPLAEVERLQSTRSANNLRLAANILGAKTQGLRLEAAFKLVMDLIPAQWATIGLIDDLDPQRIIFSQLYTRAGRASDEPQRIKLSDHAAFQLAAKQHHGVELLPCGVGAQQIHDLSRQFNISPLGPVYVEPLISNRNCFGLLLLAAPASMKAWSERDGMLVPAIATLISHALVDNRQIQPAAVPETIDQISVSALLGSRTIDRDAEKERLILSLAETRRRLAIAEDRARQIDIASIPPPPGGNGHPAPQLQLTTSTALEQALDDAVDKVLPIMRRRDLILDIAIAQDLPSLAILESALHQLVLALLENACLASVEKSTVNIHGATEPRDEQNDKRYMTLTVKDAGQGIPHEEYGHVFDSKFHLSGDRLIAGLGGNNTALADARILAMAYGGGLEFASTLGRGTTFTLRLPVIDPLPRESQADTSEEISSPETDLEFVPADQIA